MLSYDPTLEPMDMLSKIVVEMNRQFDSTNALKKLGIAAYGTQLINLASPPWSAPDGVVVNHGLGYAPMFMVFFGKISIGGIFSTPLIDYSIFGFNGVVSFSVDSQNLLYHWNDSAPTPQQSITYLIFTNPIVNS